jgi:D-serine deaminase-like pyridoxal phosphate-dependent protein
MRLSSDDTQARATQARLDRATADLDPPFAVVDLDAFDANARDLARRATGVPIRVASKSVRVRSLVDRAVAAQGFSGVMTFALREAIWLARNGQRDLLMGYPTADRSALRHLAMDEELRSSIVLMVDHPAQLRLIRAAGATAERPVRVCLDVDASLRLGPVHLGVRRSPVHRPEQAAEAAAVVARQPGVELVGLMFYDAQIAGLPDASPAVRWVKRRSAADLAQRRTAVHRAVHAVLGRPLTLVNAGGTGSLEVDASDPVVTELTAGSGLFSPALFDGYRAFASRPSAWFALPVVRRPHPRVATAFGGGYAASGPAGPSRSPRPTFPPGLSLLRGEGAGEVQTPLRGRAARDLMPGDRVWLRHAKAGEMCERFDVVHLVRGDERVGTVPTYRGEGQTFG